jgi:hypothetical protein
MMTGETIDDEGWLEEDLLPRFPVRLVRLANGKVDKVPMWKDWANKATVQCPWNAGDVPGVPMGWRSGLILVDADGEAGRAWVLAQIACGRWPETRHHCTERGWHFFFRYAEGLTNQVGLVPGIDIRTDKGFAAWWPKRGRPWEDRPIAALPAVIVEAFGRRGRAGAGAAGLGVASFIPKSNSTKQSNLTELQVRLLPWTPTVHARSRQEGIVRRVLMAKRGTRNPELNKMAGLFGGMVVEGSILRWEAEKLLMLACKHNGLLAEDGAAKCKATIKSGLDHGIEYWGLPLEVRD